MKKLLLSFALIISASYSGFAQYATSFESGEGYTLGATPQGAWGNTSLVTNREISNEYASEGTQSLKLTGNNGTNHSRAGVVSAVSEVVADVVEVKFKFYYLPSADQANNGSDFFFAPQSPADGAVVSFFRFAFDQKIYVADDASGAAAFEDTGYTFEFNQWYDCKMVVDFANSAITYYLDGELIYTGNKWSAATKVGNIAITNDNYESSAFFDEVTYFDPALSVQTFNENVVSVYPNPAKDVVNIKNTIDTQLNSVEITDINGRVVKNVNLNSVTEAQVNISDLSTGVYMMKIVSDNGSVTKKIVKE